MLLLKVLQYGHLLKSMEVVHLQSQEIWSYFQTIKTSDFISSSLEVSSIICCYILICLVCLFIPVILFNMYAISVYSYHHTGLRFSPVFQGRTFLKGVKYKKVIMYYYCFTFTRILLLKVKPLVGFFII